MTVWQQHQARELRETQRARDQKLKIPRNLTNTSTTKALLKKSLSSSTVELVIDLKSGIYIFLKLVIFTYEMCFKRIVQDFFKKTFYFCSSCLAELNALKIHSLAAFCSVLFFPQNRHTHRHRRPPTTNLKKHLDGFKLCRRKPPNNS